MKTKELRAMLTGYDNVEFIMEDPNPETFMKVKFANPSPDDEKTVEIFLKYGERTGR